MSRACTCATRESITKRVEFTLSVIERSGSDLNTTLETNIPELMGKRGGGRGRGGGGGGGRGGGRGGESASWNKFLWKSTSEQKGRGNSGRSGKPRYLSYVDKLKSGEKEAA